MGRLARRMLAISAQETSFDRRGFRCDSAAVRERFEGFASCSLRGYHAALETSGLDALAATIDAEVAPDDRGFAYEGAGMGLSVLDALTPGRRDRLRRFLAGPGQAHVYIINIGAGWALARLPIAADRLLTRLDPLLGWLAIEGYGFHQGFFRWPRAVARQEVPRRLKGYARRAFDRGLGRSLWFVEGADPGRVTADIAAFAPARRRDLWSGVGLACAYAGGADRGTLEALRLAAGSERPTLAQGVAFAAAARIHAGNAAAHTALACGVICRMTLEEAAAVSERARPFLSEAESPEMPRFELWRQRVEQGFRSEMITP